MATRTSVGSGLWSAVGTWDTGVPVDGDTVVIASGHTVTFDVDQSSFVTGIQITVTGVLEFSKTAGTYYMKGKKDKTLISGSGVVNCGTLGDPIPFVAKHTIQPAHGNNYAFDGTSGLTVNIYGTEPAIKYVKLSGNEAGGQTRLEVDTDVTGDIWAVGDTIAICNINNGGSWEYRVISGIATGYIDISVGLSTAKLAGAYVVLCARNVTVLSGYYGAVAAFVLPNKFNVGSGIFKVQSDVCFGAYRNCKNILITGGIFIGSGYASQFNSCEKVTINDGVFIGCNNIGSYNYGVFGSNRGVVINGGLFVGNKIVVGQCKSVYISGGIFAGNTYAIYYGVDVQITGGTFEYNTYDLLSTCGESRNVSFLSTVPYYEYSSLANGLEIFLSKHIGGVAGATKAWSAGGVVTSQTVTKPTGYTQAYQHALESASYPSFWYKQFSVEPGKTVNIEVQLRKSASMTYLPRVYLMNSVENPLAGSTPVDTFTMTNSTDTWETDTFSITNSTDYDQDYTLWFVAKNATGNAYSAYDITTEGGTGGGGAVSIQPVFGRLGL